MPDPNPNLDLKLITIPDPELEKKSFQIRNTDGDIAQAWVDILSFSPPFWHYISTLLYCTSDA
jgi:hypothetical protein